MVWFLWANLATIGVVWLALPTLRPPDAGPWMRAVCGLLLAEGIILGTTLLAGISGNLRPEVLAALPTLLLLPAWFLRGEREPWALPPTDPWTAAGAVALITAAGMWLAGPFWTGTRFVFDDITYHAAVPAIWTQWQAIDSTNLTYQDYYPFNAELLGLWFVVPLGDFTHAGIGVLLTAALTVASMGALAERLEIPRAPLLALLGALLAGHKMQFFARTYSANDLAMSAFLLAMLVFTLHKGSARTAVWSGLAAGAAMGTKVSGAPMVAMVGLVWLARVRQDPRWVSAFMLAMMPLGAYWYVHNLSLTGNPLFPAEVGPFEGPLDRKTQGRTTLAWFFAHRSKSISFWTDLARSRLDWPVPIGIIVAVSYLRPRMRGGWALITLSALLFLVLHPFQPFSGTINRPASQLHLMHRYVALPILIGILLASANQFRRPLTLFALGIWGWNLALQWPKLSSPTLLWIAFAGFGGLLFVAFRTRPLHRLPVWLALGLVVLAVRTPQKRKNTLHNTRAFTQHGRYHTKAWRELDKLPAGSTIAWISDLPPSHAFNLPNLGSRLQFQLVPLDRDARRHEQPLHTRWDPKRRWWADFKHEHPEELPVLRNLLDSDVDYAIISRCQQSNKGGWPTPRTALMRNARPHAVHRDKCTEIWDLAPIRELKELKELVEPPKPRPRPKPRPQPGKRR